MKKSLLKLLGLVVCTVLLLAGCRPEETYERPLFYHIFANANSNTDSYIRVSDSTVSFNQISGSYGCYREKSNGYFFSFTLTNPLSSSEYGYIYNYFRIDINTKMIPPEIFFQKRTWEIDSIQINNHPPYTIGGSGLPLQGWTFAAQCVLVWDSVFYGNEIFKGKGSFEIKDTIHTSGIYYPPQKIEFEFK